MLSPDPSSVFKVHKRPLVFVTAIACGDYLLWNWSLNANHETVALLAGLTLPPLVLATAWLIALAVGRGVARSARWVRLKKSRRASAAEQAARRNERGTSAPLGEAAAQSAPVEPPSKIAA
jgi:hypothetical protein